MALPKEQVVKIAELARLHLTEAEIEQMSHQLGSVLESFEQLGSIDTEGVEPMAHPIPMQNVFREDARQECLSLDAALANAPKRTGDFFAVPAVFE
jgi:aspartyl-tRNA(Asn)/glutamyl-tRNA(Gln) amidotransferase subunit C